MTLPRQRVLLSLILELLSLEIPAFGREIANSAEVRELLLADQPLQKRLFLCCDESKAGFSREISPRFEISLACRFSRLRTTKQKFYLEFE